MSNNIVIAKTAIVSDEAEIGDGTKIFDFAIVNAGARIGRNCIIGPYTFIENAQIGDETRIWHYSQVRRDAKLGERIVIGKNVFVDFGVPIGNDTKIQNNVSVYHGVSLDNAVFVGPHVCFTNDLRPRATNFDGSLKTDEDWELSKTMVKKGASIGANATIRAGVELGEYCLIGSGSVVTRLVKPYHIVVGNPARFLGYACRCGAKANYDPGTQELTCRANPLEHKLTLTGLDL